MKVWGEVYYYSSRSQNLLTVFFWKDLLGGCRGIGLKFVFVFHTEVHSPETWSEWGQREREEDTCQVQENNRKYPEDLTLFAPWLLLIKVATLGSSGINHKELTHYSCLKSACCRKFELLTVGLRDTSILSIQLLVMKVLFKNIFPKIATEINHLLG